MNDDVSNELIDYIKHNNIDEVVNCIEKGAFINYYRGLPLASAIELGHYEIIKLLVDKGADINVHDGYFLYLACENNHGEIMELLLSEGIHYKGRTDSIIGECISNDDSRSLSLLIQYHIVKIVSNQEIWNADYEFMTMWDACLVYKATNVIQFIIDNYYHIIPECSKIKQRFIKKYNFIRMLISRDIIDIAD